MINKVVFFRYLPLTQKVYRDFYLQEIKDAGFCVEYWYLPFIIPVPNEVEYYEDDCIRVIPSYKVLDKSLKQEDREHTLFISIQTYSGNVLKLFWYLTKNQCKLSVFGKNMIPVAPISIKAKFEQHTISQVINGISNKLAYFLKKMGVIKSYDVLFLSAETGINAYGYNTQKEKYCSKHILVNGDDYDRALSIKSEKRILKENYIVFIDTCLPLHPDIKICNLQSMNPDVYYNDLNAFFDKIESESNLKVIIAAHPKSLIYKEKDYFCGRKVFFGKTAELIRDSLLVLFHNSTSVGYAVCFEKPILSLVSKAMKEGQRATFDSTLYFSDVLNSRLVYIDDYCLNKNEYILDNISIDKEAYSQYKYRYLTNPETENSISSKLVIEGLRNL